MAQYQAAKDDLATAQQAQGEWRKAAMRADMLEAVVGQLRSLADKDRPDLAKAIADEDAKAANRAEKVYCKTRCTSRLSSPAFREKPALRGQGQYID